MTQATSQIETSKSIISSLLDTDLYKISMMAAVMHRYPKTNVRYQFFNRGRTPFPANFAFQLRQEINALATISLQPDEAQFLRKACPYLSPAYIDLLSGYRFNPSEVSVYQSDENLEVKIEGPWYRTILWEVPLMAIISELYFVNAGHGAVMPPNEFIDDTEYNVTDKAANKADALYYESCSFADFGTRRRYSKRVHDFVIQGLIKGGQESFVGTSNVHFAMKYGIKPIGTMAHEWAMYHAAKYGYRSANKMMMGRWSDIYNGNLGIVLTDTFTTDNFFSSFDTFYAKLFDGIRHDSADPYAFGDMAIEHYKKLNIDPMTKTIVFSDGLTYVEAINLQKHFDGRIKVSFGIGTHFTNDVGAKPLNIVIKMTGVNIDGSWVPAIKLSDEKGKHTGDAKEIASCKQVLGIR